MHFNKDGIIDALGIDTNKNGKLDTFIIDKNQDGKPDYFKLDTDEMENLIRLPTIQIIIKNLIHGLMMLMKTARLMFTGMIMMKMEK